MAEDVITPPEKMDLSPALPDEIEGVFPASNADNLSVHSRGYNYRIILRLGDEGHNIPSITFADDADGNAKSVLASDVSIFLNNSPILTRSFLLWRHCIFGVGTFHGIN